MDNLYNTGIRPAVTEYLKLEAEKLRDYGSYWSASSAGYCMRLVIMRRLGVPKTPELQESQDITTRVFESGKIFHEWLQNITKQAGLSIASEVELQDEDLMIRGHFDDLILVGGPEVKEDGTAGMKERRLILYDYKTAHSKWFEYVKGRPMSYYNKMQLGTYMYMLRKLGRDAWPEPVIGVDKLVRNLTEARILKISKDDLRLHEQQLLWSDELGKEVLAYWRVLQEWWKQYPITKKLSPCTCLDQENGFMGKRSKAGKVYNDYFYQDEPCSQAWYEKWKAEAK